MAATALYQPNSQILDRKGLASLYSRTFDAIRKVKDAMPRQLAQFFSERVTNLETYKEGEASATLDVPQKNEDTDRIPLATPMEGHHQTWTNVQRRLGIMVTRRAVKSQKTRMIAQLLTGLPNAAKALEELSYTKLFTDGFATTTCADGEYIFDTAHNYMDTQFGTWSGAAASGATFSTTSYFTAWLNLRQRKNEKGLPNPLVPGEVLYPPAIHEAVMKVAGSSQYPQNSLNAKMPALFGQFKPVCGDWLTSTIAWFVHAKVDEADRSMVIVWQDKPQYSPISDSMNPELIMGKRLLMSFSVGCLIPRDWYGNVGA